MKHSAQLARSVLNDCAEAILLQQLDGTIIGWNNSAQVLLGHPMAELIGQSGSRLLPTHKNAEDAAARQKIATGETLRLRTLRLHQNGQQLPVLLTLSPIRDEGGVVIGMSSILRNATLLSHYDDDELVQLVFHDALTGLCNRTYLMDRLHQAMRRDERTHYFGAVLFLDLDDFKKINDCAGHDVGDQILIKAARRLQRALREYDTIARWGGDEFVVMIEDLDENFSASLDKAAVIAQHLLKALRRPYVCDSHIFRCPPSIGVACYRGIGVPLTQVIKNADSAMYQAKAQGKGCIHIDRRAPAELRHVAALASVSELPLPKAAIK